MHTLECYTRNEHLNKREHDKNYVKRLKQPPEKFGVHFKFLVQSMSYLITWRVGVYDLNRSKPPGGDQEFLASLLGPSSFYSHWSTHVANVNPSPQVFVSSLLSTDFSSSSAYCSSSARAFSPSPLTSGSTSGPSNCAVWRGRESSSALTASRVSDSMLLISCSP